MSQGHSRELEVETRRKRGFVTDGVTQWLAGWLNGYYAMLCYIRSE